MILILDNVFTKEGLDAIRLSAINGGFGTWSPPSAVIGSGKYEGMSYIGDHAPLHQALTGVMGQSIFPNQSFFRILTESTEKRYIHSDRSSGQFTCITYLSDHGEDVSGTEFYKHRATGRTEMPSLKEMQDNGELAQMSNEMVDGSDDHWEKLDFVRGLYGRMLIFNSPLFHARFPLHGIGISPENARMIWVCHFMTTGGGI